MCKRKKEIREKKELELNYFMALNPWEVFLDFRINLEKILKAETFHKANI